MQKRWIWPFELQEQIGQGAMGIVYRARYVKNDRIVAVKLLPEEIARNKTVVARFERELEVLKTLKHPNIVHCFGGKCEGEQHFYAMELVEGGSLDHLLRKRGRLPWEQAISYTLQICAALACAHERGFVHRDVKPANLLLSKTGQLKLSDFGLARARSEVRLTAAGKTMGTFHYMAPEQIRGNPPLSPQTDLYAMGCVLFEMITGDPPFRGNSPAEILQKHLEQPPPSPSAAAMDCPAALDKIISDLLEKDPDRRPSSAIAAARSLKKVTQTISIQVGTQHFAPGALPSGTDDGAGYRDRISRSWLSRINQTWALAICSALLLISLIWNITLLANSGAQDPRAARSQALWLEAYRHKNEAVRIAAIRALGEIGAPATVVPKLIEGLEDNSAKVRRAAAAALGDIGEDAKSAVAVLLKLVKSDENQTVRSNAGEALRKIRGNKQIGSAGGGKSAN